MSDYRNRVQSIAKEIRERYPNPEDDDRYQAIWETVDGSGWLYREEDQDIVLEDTGNYPDEREVAELDGGSGDWRKVKQITATLAMQGDVRAKLEELDEEAFESKARKRWPRRT